MKSGQSIVDQFTTFRNTKGNEGQCQFKEIPARNFPDLATAIDQYAEEVACRFADWVDVFGYLYDESGVWYTSDRKVIAATTSELFQIFKSQK